MTIFSKSFLLLLSFVLAVVFSCKDEILHSEISASINQVGKCNKQGLNKSAGECFEYSFNDDLLIKFCVSGNCCPDSSRFVSIYKINGDMITIIIKDIAPNLCKCLCNYTIQADFKNLPLNSYFVVCMQETSEGLIELYDYKIFR